VPPRKLPSVLVVAAGIATVRCFPILSPLISPRHIAVYHQQGPAWRLFLPILMACVAAWLVVLGVLKLTRRWAWLRLGFWAALASLLPLIVVSAVCSEIQTALSHELEGALFLFSALCFGLLLILARRSTPTQVARVLRLAELGAALTAWSGLVLLGQTLWAFHAAEKTTEAALLSASPNAPPSPTVIWILLDELSENQVFDHRFPGLALPAFDRIAGQSTTFTHAVAANLFTEAALPGLMTGLPVKKIEASADGGRLTLDLRSGARQSFDAQQTVFGDAQRLGYPTSVVGWYNPYCRILPTVLNRCTWVAHGDNLSAAFRSNSSFRQNLVPVLLTPIPFRARLMKRLGFQIDRVLRRDHIAEYRKLESASLSLLAEPHPGFVMLHIAAPHPEGIYNRHTGVLSDAAPLSYVDNLALADRFLGEVEETLAKKQEWDQATIVIMGDHSWRTQQIWRASDIWTPEDEIASQHGAFDDRPGYLVKLPGQHTAARIDAPYDALRSRALFDQILAGQIQTPEQLAVWAAHP
jgi:hypothetical protein